MSKALIIAVVGIVVLAGLGWWVWASREPYRRSLTERYAFQHLADVVNRDLQTRHDHEPAYIQSIDELWQVIAEGDPALTIVPESPNPFPDLFHEEQYGVLRGPVTGPTKILMWGGSDLPLGERRVHFALAADGAVRVLSSREIQVLESNHAEID